MKKCILPLFLVFTLLCTGCMRVYDPAGTDILAEVAGEDVHILFNEGSTKSGTVQTGHGDYRFAYGADGVLTIIYPNGHVYSRLGDTEDWPYPDSAKSLGYLSGDALCASLDLASGVDMEETTPAAPASGVPMVVSVGLAALGLWLLLSPMGAWKLIVESFRPDAEPKKRTLRIYRLVGAALAVTGCLLLFL